MPYLFQNATAFDPYTGQGVPNATGQVYAMADTAFATPLTVILLSSGLQTTELVSDQYSQLPGFDAGDNVQVRFRSGEFVKVLNTSTPLVGTQGVTGKSAFEVAVEGGYTGTEAEYNATLTDAPSLVARAETAEAAAVDAANLVGAPADTAIAMAINGPGTQTATALNAAIADTRKSTAAQEVALTGPELVTSTGWSLGAGWTGDFATGFTHAAGSTAPLTWTPPFPTGTNLYLVVWNQNSTVLDPEASDYWVSLGGGSAGITYQGLPVGDANYSRGIRSLADGSLVIDPGAGFAGKLSGFSVKAVTGTAPIPYGGWKTSTGARATELRAGRQSVFLGLTAGESDISGDRNAGFGNYALQDNVSGFYNAAFGWSALANNINGTRNSAFGYNTLAANTSGDRNVAVGPFALTRNTTGRANVAIGTDVLWRNTTGNDNIGCGYLTLTELLTGSGNIAVGKYAMRQSKTAEKNVAIGGGALYNNNNTGNIAVGEDALWASSGEGNIAIGRNALKSAGSASGNVAIGDYALESSASSSAQQTAVGKEALRHYTGNRNTAFGHNAMKGVAGASTGTRNVAIGDNAGLGMTTGNNNTLIGPSVASSLTTGSGNIFIGFAAGATFGADAQSKLDIGGVLYGDIVTKQFGIGRAPTANLHVAAGKATPGGAPFKVDPGPLLTEPEIGALEFSAGVLYFTTSTGNRRPLAFA